ncbi:MAG TPA: Rne/Rng family ribonuclease [Candidatus Nitrosotenuis sp.]|jgi:ribonuclease G|nr:Rne/Rng family ribonuclease [Candidatus Nitrosotenuis sp.]
MYKEILVTLDNLESRAAVLEDGVLVEVMIARQDRTVGSIYKGRVANVLPGMNAAFVDVGLERNAFLCFDDAAAHLGEEAQESLKSLSIKDILKVNQETLVQVVKEAVGTKGARVTTYITLPGRYLVLLPSAQYIGVSRRIESEEERSRLRQAAEKLRPDGMGVIVRTAAEGHSFEELEGDLGFLLKMWQNVQEQARKKRAPALVHQEVPLVEKLLRDTFNAQVDRLIIDRREDYEKIREILSLSAPSLVNRVHLYTDRRPLFEVHGIETEIEKALSRKVWLESGGYLIIDRTEALWVIDVNTGKFIGKTSLADTILKNNLEAVKEICRQLRLRDMSGIIIIDFIDMESAADRRRVLEALAEELRKDRVRTHLVGMTELGLVQLTRKREGKDLDTVLREACPYCSGRGRILARESVAIKVHREILRQGTGGKGEAVLAEVNPRVAVDLVGFEGEHIAELETQTGKPVYIKADPSRHQEHFEVSSGSLVEVEKKIKPLREGHEAVVRLEESFGLNVQSAAATIEGHLCEVLAGGDRLGQTVRVKVKQYGRATCQAEILGKVK